MKKLLVAFFIVISINLSAQKKQIICKDFPHEANGPYGVYTDSTYKECSYKSIKIVEVSLFSPLQGTAYLSYSKIYNNNVEIKKLSDLLNDNSSELIDNINLSFRAQYDSLLNLAHFDKDLEVCLNSSGYIFKLYSIDNISINFSKENNVIFSVSLRMMKACSFANFFTYTITIDEFDKYLKP